MQEAGALPTAIWVIGRAKLSLTKRCQIERCPDLFLLFAKKFLVCKKSAENKVFWHFLVFLKCLCKKFHRFQKAIDPNDFAIFSYPIGGALQEKYGEIAAIYGFSKICEKVAKIAVFRF